jgi:hypothetical protein
MLTADAARLRRLETELVQERHKRRMLEQRVGGLTSLAVRLRAALTEARAEAVKPETEEPCPAKP